MAKTGKSGPAGNQGIQAKVVTAEVMAVGRGASAHKQVTLGGGPQEFRQAVVQLRTAIDGLALPTPAKQVLTDDLDGLATALVAAKPDATKVQSYLKGLDGKLKMVGLILKDIIELSGPAKKIAELAMIPLHLVGL